MTETYDIAVLGGTPGGIATAVRSAREGHDVVLVTYNAHLGGMMAGGLSYTDTLTKKARSPLLEEFLERSRSHYADTYGKDSSQYEYCEDGYIFEPHVAEEIFDSLVEDAQLLDIAWQYRPSSVRRKGREITEATFESIDDGADLSIAADVFVDASYAADLAALSGVSYSVGREAREEYDEQFAGRLFTQLRGDQYYPREAVGNDDYSAPVDRKGPLDVPEEKQRGELDLIPHPAGLTEIYPQSTGEGDERIQAYNYRLCLTRDPENRRYPEKPSSYDRTEYETALREVRESGLRSYLRLRYLPNDKADMNSADLPGENYDYPDGDWETRDEIARRHRQHALGLFYFLQNDEAVPSDVREQAREWGLAKDEFVENDNFPWQLYVREARRIHGRYVFTENDARHARGIGRTPITNDSIAIAEYPLDSHGCRKECQTGSQPEGFFYASQVTRPSQIPYRSLLPETVDNLLVPVALSTTHVSYGTIRLEPTWMHIGESAGFAAAQAVSNGVNPGDIDVSRLQTRLVANGIMISFFNEYDMSTDEPWTEAIQWLGAHGFFDSYDASPEEGLDATIARRWLEVTRTILTGGSYDCTDAARSLDESGETITATEFDRLAAEILPEARTVDTPFEGTQTLTRGAACQALYETITASQS
ncbi:FAD-dependent oxidoreductase [Natronorubrum halophilum]|uniref:FAD-dependent oxidoreductase n=1 Tax=Natronorubrum halophilum TaxID=1702106 RepID=UPI000EF6AA41|nr:FAD-dependent oxidoreductase [Natronorubrum halophilum]